MIRIPRYISLLLATITVVVILSKCINGNVKNDPRGNVYAGPQACRQCHQPVYDSFVNTSHYNTTQPASPENVRGSFDHGNNTYVYDAYTKIVMEERDSGLFQVLYVNDIEKEAYRMDITFGVKHAQTFLRWDGAKTYELPVSYYIAAQKWGSSPGGGFSTSKPFFQRAVGVNCYECHSSYISNKLTMHGLEGIEETLDRSTLVMGIDCERCHGPAINHVNYQQAYPQAKEAKYIVSSSSLSAQQLSDACAVCHGGNDTRKEISPFGFKMGDTLANYFAPFGRTIDPEAGYDVHGNQYGLLAQSKCFIKSRKLTCVTCHDPHKDAGNELKVYSATCIGCHANPNHPSLDTNSGTTMSIQNNCIDCHMPLQPSGTIAYQLAGGDATYAYLLRTHKIAVYKDEKVAALIKAFDKL